MVVDTKEPQQNLLRQVLDISGAMPESGRKKPPQPLARLPLEVRNEGLFVGQSQIVFPCGARSRKA